MERPLVLHTSAASTAPIADTHTRGGLARQIAFMLLTLFALVCGGAVLSANAQIGAHAGHTGNDEEMLAEMSGAVKLVEARPSADASRANVARNPGGTFEVFTLDVPIEGSGGSLRETIFVQDIKSKKIYEVQGFDFPRPFSALAWANDRTLVFDQMMQPTHGAHYAINVETKRLVVARVFDEPPSRARRPNAESKTAATPAAATVTPEKIVRDFYVWYIAALNAGKTPTDDKRTMSKYVAAGTIRQLTRDYAAGEIDADPFLDLQDFDETWAQAGNIKVAAPQLNGAVATARVTFTGQNWTEAYSLNVTLKREGGAWKIVKAVAAQSR